MTAQTDIILRPSNLTPLQAALAAVIKAYCAMIIAAQHPQHMLRLVQSLRRKVWENCRLQAKVLASQLRQDLATNPALRARVRADLGGQPALRKWEARRLTAKIRAAHYAARIARGWDAPDTQQNPDTQKNIEPIRATITRQSRPAWQPKTDRAGLFRLAILPAIPRQRPRQTQTSSSQNIQPRTRRTEFIFHPVQVTSEELRAAPSVPSFQTSSAKDSPPPGYATPVLRPPI
ncbi:hypothetical protein AB8615_00610 [Litorimonas sp. RW-G-Af-16]|uniref:hypothetical protein n=1 Tax=Litorimonas sp. RW-G-Af-16 TaxID=3241168 RepID=UPI003AB02A7D